MIKSIVYKSSTGHTKQYAEMLGESLKIPVYNLEEAKSSLKKNDEIIFLGWVCATKIQGLSKIKRYNVKCIGAVGAYPAEKNYIESLKNANKVNVELFYLRGGQFHLLQRIEILFLNHLRTSLNGHVVDSIEFYHSIPFQ